MSESLVLDLGFVERFKTENNKSNIVIYEYI